MSLYPLTTQFWRATIIVKNKIFYPVWPLSISDTLKFWWLIILSNWRFEAESSNNKKFYLRKCQLSWVGGGVKPLNPSSNVSLGSSLWSSVDPYWHYGLYRQRRYAGRCRRARSTWSLRPVNVFFVTCLDLFSEPVWPINILLT